MNSMRYSLMIALLFALVMCLFAGSLLIGPAAIGLKASVAALFQGEGEMVTLVMREVRLPRAILGALVGGALGLSGAVMQGLLRNPLAEPGLIGTSSAAALGAVITIQTGLSAAFALALPLAALAGALISVGLILLLAGPRGTILTLILAGIGLSALATAFTSLVLNLSPNPFAASEIMFWMMGSLADRSMLHVQLALPFMVLGALIMARTGGWLKALTLGEDAATSMGVNVTRLRILLVVATASLVGAATAVAGAIGFVGLIVPHLLRRAVGANPTRLLWASALGGAAVILAADVAVRIIAPDRDLKLGVLTALVGAPFFLNLILRTRRETA